MAKLTPKQDAMLQQVAEVEGDEFFVVCHDGKPLRFGSYSTAAYVKSPFLASVYGTRPKADARVKPGSFDIYIEGLKVRAASLRVKRVYARVISIT